MYHRLEQIYYASAAFLLIGVLFVLQTQQTDEANKFGQNIRQEFASEFALLVAPIDPLADLAFLWESNDKFYKVAAVETALVLELPEIPTGTRLAFDRAALAVNAGLSHIYAEIMDADGGISASSQEPEPIALNSPDPEPIYNIVPPFDLAGALAWQEANFPGSSQPIALNEPASSVLPSSDERGEVAGVVFDPRLVTAPANTDQYPWVTLKDNLTGEPYCVAIFNTEVNKYPGKCIYDYY